jgi:hypothetical protein
METDHAKHIQKQITYNYTKDTQMTKHNDRSDFMSEEQNAITDESEQLGREIADFGHELEAFKDEIMGPLRSYRAIGWVFPFQRNRRCNTVNQLHGAVNC